jgi:hypothetical protein
MEVNVPTVPGRVNNVPKYFVLKSLNHSNVARFCAHPYLDAIGPHRFQNLFI